MKFCRTATFLSVSLMLASCGGGGGRADFFYYPTASSAPAAAKAAIPSNANLRESTYVYVQGLEEGDKVLIESNGKFIPLYPDPLRAARYRLPIVVQSTVTTLRVTDISGEIKQDLPVSVSPYEASPVPGADIASLITLNSAEIRGQLSSVFQQDASLGKYAQLSLNAQDAFLALIREVQSQGSVVIPINDGSSVTITKEHLKLYDQFALVIFNASEYFEKVSKNRLLDFFLSSAYAAQECIDSRCLERSGYELLAAGGAITAAGGALASLGGTMIAAGLITGPGAIVIEPVAITIGATGVIISTIGIATTTYVKYKNGEVVQAERELAEFGVGLVVGAASQGLKLGNRVVGGDTLSGTLAASYDAANDFAASGFIDAAFNAAYDDPKTTYRPVDVSRNLNIPVSLIKPGVGSSNPPGAEPLTPPVTPPAPTPPAVTPPPAAGTLKPPGAKINKADKIFDIPVTPTGVIPDYSLDEVCARFYPTVDKSSFIKKVTVQMNYYAGKFPGLVSDSSADFQTYIEGQYAGIITLTTDIPSRFDEVRTSFDQSTRSSSVAVNGLGTAKTTGSGTFMVDKYNCRYSFSGEANIGTFMSGSPAVN